jgi:hypothetical protein
VGQLAATVAFVDSVEFLVRGDAVRIVVNGRDLIARLAEIERPQARAEGLPGASAGYEGLSTEFLPPCRHFLGEPTLAQEGKAYLLGCSCGAPDCWPFLARVAIADGIVRWSDFENGFRDWRYDDLGPFEFSLREYQGSLERAAAAANSATRTP